jgi:hypothetical protein
MARYEETVTTKGACPVTGGCDRLTCLLSRVGFNRSALVTLALLPYSWAGLTWAWNSFVGVADTLIKLFHHSNGSWLL